MQKASHQGFTLIELSIVLVIIGLIVGGVLAGQSLIRAAQLQSIATDANKFVTAVYTFQDKYNALPGDMANATNYWGTNPNCASYGAGTGTQTCNGDGNGIVEPYYYAIPMESVYFWQHLSNAGLVQGTYTGVPGPGGPFEMIIGQNVPASKWSGTGFSLYYLGSYAGDVNTFPANYGHTLMVGGQIPTWAAIMPTMTPETVFEIDRKVDDGKPGTGHVMSGNANNNQCSTTDDPDTAAYNVANTSTAKCCPYFITGF